MEALLESDPVLPSTPNIKGITSRPRGKSQLIVTTGYLGAFIIAARGGVHLEASSDSFIDAPDTVTEYIEIVDSYR